jgi:hypothetical protein
MKICKEILRYIAYLIAFTIYLIPLILVVVSR